MRTSKTRYFSPFPSLFSLLKPEFPEAAQWRHLSNLPSSPSIGIDGIPQPCTWRTLGIDFVTKLLYRDRYDIHDIADYFNGREEAIVTDERDDKR